jgi:tetratricopeptide (TPR) repeat protein
VTIRLIRVRTGEVALTVPASADNAVELVTALDRALRALQRRIGESQARLREQPLLAYATTSNLEALRAYSEGVAAWQESRYAIARDLWERAVTLDTGFALAMGSLGASYYYTHNRQQAASQYQRALARAARLSEWERLRIASGYATARGDLDSALAVDRRIAATFPRALTYYDLGTDLLQMRRCPEALEAFERSRRLDPLNPHTAINIATCHKVLGDFDRARLAYLEAGRLDSTMLYRANINLEYAGALVLTGRATEAESVLSRMSGRIEMADQALGFRGLGYLALWQGRIEPARARFARAAAISRQQHAAPSLLRNLLLLVAAERAGRDQSPDRRVLATIDSLTRLEAVAPTFLTFAVGPHADDRDGAIVTALLERMRHRVDPRSREDSSHIWYVTGALALAEGHAADALNAFDRAGEFRFPTTLALRRAMALEQLGQLDSARAVLRSILAKNVFGSEDQIGWMKALVAVGQVEERAGRVEDAIASYRRFLDFWKEADAGLPDVVRVQARLNALLSRTDRSRD